MERAPYLILNWIPTPVSQNNTASDDDILRVLTLVVYSSPLLKRKIILK